MGLGMRIGDGRGRKAAELPLVLGLEELTAEEAASVGERETVVKPTPLQRVTTRHKRAARLLARGETTSQVALMTGLTVSRVSILKQDPAFQQQVAIYEHEMRELGQAMDEAITEGLQNLTLDAIDRLEEKLELEGEDMSSGELLSIIRQGADRIGHAPKRVEEKNVTVNFGDRLQAARQRVIEHSRTLEAEIIDVEAAE